MKPSTKVAVGITTLLTGQLALNAGIYFYPKMGRADRYWPTNAALKHTRQDHQEHTTELCELEKKNRRQESYPWRPLGKRITKTVSLW